MPEDAIATVIGIQLKLPVSTRYPLDLLDEAKIRQDPRPPQCLDGSTWEPSSLLTQFGIA
jgi:hypothetical protein